MHAHVITASGVLYLDSLEEPPHPPGKYRRRRVNHFCWFFLVVAVAGTHKLSCRCTDNQRERWENRGVANSGDVSQSAGRTLVGVSHPIIHPMSIPCRCDGGQIIIDGTADGHARATQIEMSKPWIPMERRLR